MILTRLLTDTDTILERITESQLSRYDHLQRLLPIINVAEDREYQTTFNGYYRMQRRARDWYSFFFSVLEREKLNQAVSFRQTLEEIYRSRHSVEPSFCSKLIATIRPDKPVYDKYVRTNLSLVIPRPSEPAEQRIQKLAGVYSGLEAQMAMLTQSEAFQELKRRFDSKFPSYIHFTDMKKLDLLLWQYRE